MLVRIRFGRLIPVVVAHLRMESNRSTFVRASFYRNNAGYMSGKFELSPDGLEKVFATNQIGQ